MANQNRTDGREVQTSKFSALGSSGRRSILAILIDRTSAVSERELALTLGATEQGTSMAAVPDDRARAIRTELRHSHLPSLEDSGLITWERDDETIATTDHAALDDPRFHRLLETETDGVDDALLGLSNKRRRHLLTILRDDQSAISQTELAREITRRENDEPEPSRATIDETMATLVHIHLPLLVDADIVEYDAETGRVAYTGHPGVEALAAIFPKPDTRLTDRLNGFLGGLLNSYKRASTGTGDPFDWPNSWSDSRHG